MHANNPFAGASGTGLLTIADDNTVLDAWFPMLRLCTDVRHSQTTPLAGREIPGILGRKGSRAVRRDARRGVNIVAIRTEIADLAEPPVGVADIYLRLQLMSHRLIRPRQANLEGMIAMLANVAWTSIGPCLPEHVDIARWLAHAEGQEFDVRSVFKLPRMTDYVMPSGVSIANSNHVLLGAHLAAGTTVTQTGFCSFNAGTLGPATVEGHISPGVVIGEGSEIGATSVMGTLCERGREIIAVGKNCRIGANAGLGISLGDNCSVEAGCHITACDPVMLPTGDVIMARQLSGRSHLSFRRNAATTHLEAIDPSKGWSNLHAMPQAANDCAPRGPVLKAKAVPCG